MGRIQKVNSSKKGWFKTGFTPGFSVKDAILEIIESYNSNKLIDNQSCYTVKWMKKLKLNE